MAKSKKKPMELKLPVVGLSSGEIVAMLVLTTVAGKTLFPHRLTVDVVMEMGVRLGLDFVPDTARGVAVRRATYSKAITDALALAELMIRNLAPPGTVVTSDYGLINPEDAKDALKLAAVALERAR